MNGSLSWQKEFYAIARISIWYHVFLAVAIVTILGNLSVAICIVFGSREIKPILMVLASLAVLDTLGGCTGVYKYLYFDAEVVPANIYTCWINYFAQVLCYISSCLHISALTIDCYLGAEKPLKRHRKPRKLHTALIIMGCWIIPVLYNVITIPTAIISFNDKYEASYVEYWYNNFKCTLDNEYVDNFLIIVTMSVIFTIPILNIILHARIYWIIQHRTAASRKSKNMKCLLTSCLLCLAFIIFYMPVLIVGIMRKSWQLTENDTTAYLYPLHVVTRLPILNSMSHPLLYGFRISGVRQGLRNLVRLPTISKASTSSNTNDHERQETQNNGWTYITKIQEHSSNCSL